MRIDGFGLSNGRSKDGKKRHEGPHPLILPSRTLVSGLRSGCFSQTEQSLIAMKPLAFMLVWMGVVDRGPSPRIRRFENRGFFSGIESRALTPLTFGSIFSMWRVAR